MEISGTEKKRIIKLWQDEHHPGSFTGLINFRRNLKKHEGIKISERQLYQVMRGVPNFVANMREPRKITTRSFDIEGIYIFVF